MSEAHDALDFGQKVHAEHRFHELTPRRTLKLAEEAWPAPLEAGSTRAYQIWHLETFDEGFQGETDAHHPAEAAEVTGNLQQKEERPSFRRYGETPVQVPAYALNAGIATRKYQLEAARILWLAAFDFEGNCGQAQLPPALAEAH